MARGDWSRSSYCGVAGLTTKETAVCLRRRLPTRARYQCVVVDRAEPGSQELLRKWGVTGLMNQGLVSQRGDILHPQVNCPEPVSVNQAW